MTFVGNYAMYTIGSILEAITAVKVSISNPRLEVQRLEYDSRKIRQGEFSLFFALKNLRDGHTFINDAYHKGVRNFVISDLDIRVDNYSEANFVWVEDTLQSLQQLAAFHRKRFPIPVIGITGSNGKTIVKEWLYQLLSVDLRCYKSPKSYNSQLGVALSLWEIQEDHQIALIEAGISRVDEMKHLEKMIQPDIGVFTSIGTAHADGFTSKEQKFEEKWNLFENSSTIIAPSEVVPVDFRDSRCFLWGNEQDVKVRVESIEHQPQGTAIKIVVDQVSSTLDIPFQDKASVENILTCITTLLALGYEMPVIQHRIKGLQPLEMRLKLKKGKNNCSIIDDSYSNDLASLKIALDFMQQQNQHEARSLVITDFIGAIWNDKFKVKLINLLEAMSFRKIVLIGESISEIADNLSSHADIFTFRNTGDLLSSLHTVDFKDETVLIKGARKFELERLSQLLVQKSHDTVLEINLKAIEHNLSQYQSKLAPGVKLMAMVKAFSYGSGSFEIANILQFNKVDYLTVAFVDEGVELRQGGIQLPIMVLSPHAETFDDLLTYNLEPEIYSLRILRAFIDFLNDKDIDQYPIHIKLDTGMHRLGFMSDEMDDLLCILENTCKVKVRSVFSHFAGAGNAAFDDFTNGQVDLFRRAADQMEKRLNYQMIKHICNSNAIVHRSEDHMDMVRLGIGLYGIDMSPKDLNLQEVGVLKTTITQIKALPYGDTVGYDRKGMLYRDSKIATVKIGYADGYDRRLGNGVGKMAINGHIVSTIGNICMDMCMLDITDIEATEGEEVVVFPDIMQAAREMATIPYEILAGISSRVKRVYYYE